MPETISYDHFNVITASLNGNNLIEASAGTGKTYSISILALRLILEQKIPIQEILMVTFTKAAVAELDDRIRNFIRLAYRYSKGEEIQDLTIKKTVDFTGKDNATELLETALIYLDEINVMTIHGFAQVTLNEFAFETGQLFNSELIPDTFAIMEKEVQDFWRKHVTVIHKDLLAKLLNIGVNQHQITKIIQEHIGGKRFLYYNSTEKYLLDEAKQQEYLDDICNFQIQIKQKEQEMLEYIQHHSIEIEKLCSGNAWAKKNILHDVPNPHLFLENIKESYNKKVKTPSKLFPDLIHNIEFYNNLNNQIKITTQNAANYLYSVAIQVIIPKIESYKLKNNFVSFDDMIQNLHKALTSSSDSNLANRLSNKYKAVFIDEFQDTDRLQYEIFNTAFHNKSIMFYIGDPKQSIYGWRKADISTYFEARNHVDRIYTMNINYRSTRRLLEALNHFFSPEPHFDTFNNKNNSDRIDYLDVHAPDNDTIGQLLYQKNACAPLNIFKYPKDDDLIEDLAYRILNILTQKDYTIYENKTQTQRPVRPSDIGILVRNNNKGVKIKERLSQLGVPAVTVSDAKILHSEQAKDLIYILEAMLQPHKANIHKVFSIPMFQYDIKSILSLDIEKITDLFRSYQELWKSRSIYTALTKLYHDLDIRQKLLNPDTVNGERMLSNLLQLTEILYKMEHRRNFNPVELVNWLKTNHNKEQSSDDEWEQRIESDDEAVRIVTIHKSKGLEYPIVFAAELDFVVDGKNKTVGFRDINENYVVATFEQLNDNQISLYEQQVEQENRRLLYVALTRAVYACFVFHNKVKSHSTLLNFITMLQSSPLIQIEDEQFASKLTEKYVTSVPQTTQKSFRPAQFLLKDVNWSRISYSSIAGHLEKTFKDNIITEKDEYDAFIFNDLPKGSNTGNFLHYIMERIDFTQSSNWAYVIDGASKLFYSNTSIKFNEYIFQMLEHVMNTDIQVEAGSLRLSDVPLSQCLHEFEFDFPVKEFNIKQLTKLMQYGIVIGDKYNDIFGMMNGKIDLFFEHNGKYYILDWKSNHLGYNLEAYTPDKSSEAMSDNNYHLQYLIYSYAIQKYLQFRKGEAFDYERDFGGVIYLFLRGVRKNSNHGIFYYKPGLDQTEQMEEMFG